jgi:hypothetical protein
MGAIGPVVVVYGDARMSERAFDRQLDELSRVLETPSTGVLYEVGGVRALDARRRKRLVEVLAERRGALRSSLVGCTVATVSPIVRGVLHAAFLLARTPVPHHVAKSTREGFAWLARQVPGLRPNAAEAEYVAALRAARIGPFADHSFTA